MTNRTDSISPPLPLAGALDDNAISGRRLRRALRLVTIAWMFGSVWITAISGTPVTLFAQGLGASKFQFGLLSALPFIAASLSLPASLLTDRTGQRKRIFMTAQYAQRLLWFPVAILPLWILTSHNASGLAMATFIVLLLLMYGSGAVGSPAWISWMADIVPERRRGKYFAIRRQWGLISAIPAALVVGWLLDHVRPAGAIGAPATVHLTTLYWCAGIFIVAAVFGVIDIATFHFVPNVPSRPKTDVPLLSILTKPLRNRQFLWFGGFVAMLVFAVSFMGQFVTLYLIEKLEVNNLQTQIMLLVAPNLGQLAVFHVWGKAADRMGKKPVLILAALGLVPVGLGWCLMSRGNIWFGYLLSSAGAALWAGVEVANLNLVLEMSSPQESSNGDEGGSAYFAVNNLIITIAGILGGLSSGLIAELLENWHWQPFAAFKQITFYEVLFAISGVLRLLAVVIFLPHIHEHDARPTAEALRFMTANIYNNLFNAVMQPARLIRFLNRESPPPPAPTPIDDRRATPPTLRRAG